MRYKSQKLKKILTKTIAMLLVIVIVMMSLSIADNNAQASFAAFAIGSISYYIFTQLLISLGHEFNSDQQAQVALLDFYNKSYGVSRNALDEMKILIGEFASKYNDDAVLPEYKQHFKLPERLFEDIVDFYAEWLGGKKERIHAVNPNLTQKDMYEQGYYIDPDIHDGEHVPIGTANGTFYLPLMPGTSTMLEFYSNSMAIQTVEVQGEIWSFRLRTGSQWNHLDSYKNGVRQVNFTTDVKYKIYEYFIYGVLIGETVYIRYSAITVDGILFASLPAHSLGVFQLSTIETTKISNQISIQEVTTEYIAQQTHIVIYHQNEAGEWRPCIWQEVSGECPCPDVIITEIRREIHIIVNENWQSENAAVLNPDGSSRTYEDTFYPPRPGEGTIGGGYIPGTKSIEELFGDIRKKLDELRGLGRPGQLTLEQELEGLRQKTGEITDHQTRELIRLGLGQIALDLQNVTTLTEVQILDLTLTRSITRVRELTQTISIPLPPPSLGGFAMFPFCIPFDVYNIFNVLIATPIEPRFEFDIVPFADADTTIVIDFTMFETIRILFRNGMLITFVIGLVVVTRRYIWTGGG
ncbi:MAG: hypothetical protein LBC71_02435 [Oscillospiraceae bacterium]|jgi:hypothetical protein|nr:hypothetical protein [Oscillospiraceae bacterium]